MRYKIGDVVIYRNDKFVSIDFVNNEELTEKNKVGLIIDEYSNYNNNQFYWVYIDGRKELTCIDWLDRLCKISSCIKID